MSRGYKHIRLKRDVYANFSAEHFQGQITEKHGVKVPSYSMRAIPQQRYCCYMRNMKLLHAVGLMLIGPLTAVLLAQIQQLPPPPPPPPLPPQMEQLPPPPPPPVNLQAPPPLETAIPEIPQPAETPEMNATPIPPQENTP